VAILTCLAELPAYRPSDRVVSLFILFVIVSFSMSSSSPDKYLALTERYGGEWKCCTFNDNYAVCRDSRVYSFLRNKILKGGYDRAGYHRVNLQGEQQSVSRVVGKAFVQGETTEAREIDHSDRKVDHDADTNLRWATRRQQMANFKLPPNTLDAKGITPIKKHFRVRITDLEGESHELGVYSTLDDSKVVYAEAAVRLHHQFVLSEIKEYWEEHKERFPSIKRRLPHKRELGKHIIKSKSGLKFHVAVNKQWVGSFDTLEKAINARDEFVAVNPVKMGNKRKRKDDEEDEKKEDTLHTRALNYIRNLDVDT
jgi:hypothetical protein